MPSIEPNTVVLTVLAGLTAWNGIAARQNANKAEAKVDKVQQVLTAATADTEEHRVHEEQHAKEVKETLTTIKDISDKTHILVNSNLGAIKLRLAQALRAMASYTKNQDDIRAAEEAERDYQDHMRKQAKVDAVPEERVVGKKK